MIDPDLKKQLVRMRSQVENCVWIYSQELERRKGPSSGSISALAPDADVIYEFLHPEGEKELSSAAIEALMQTEAVRTLILPGTQAEFGRICQNELQRLSQPIFRPEANSASAVAGERKRELFDDLRYSVAVLCDKLDYTRSAFDRLSRFLSSRCLDQNNWTDIDRAMFEPSEPDIEEIYSELSKVRRSNRPVANMVDSRNLASILAAARNGLRIPFVTNTRALLHGVGRTIKSKPTYAGLIVGPFTAVAIVSLARADTQDIKDLRKSASKLLKVMDFPTQDSDTDPDLLSEYRGYMEMTYSLAEVGFLLNRTWSPPAFDLPEALDLQHLAALALEQVELLGKKVAEMSMRFGIRIENDRTKPNVVEDTVRRTGLSVDLLKDIQSGDEKVIIKKLVILHEGAQMSEYNINQIGTNLTAVVDSFKTTQLTGSGLSTDLETQLKALLDGIVNSRLSEEEKKDAIDATKNVVEDVKKEGRLAGGTKMLWAGIRETIKSIPAALSAWDSIHQHWH